MEDAENHARSHAANLRRPWRRCRLQSLKDLGYSAGYLFAGFVNYAAFKHSGRLPFALAASAFAIASIYFNLKWIKEASHDGNNA